MNKKYQIFVSSTYTDLVEARKNIIEALLQLQHFPVGMEMFGANDSEQWDYIKNTIDASDYYIVIIGHRYGSVADDGTGFTEKEYDYAASKGIPVLAFIRDRDAATKPHEREKNLDQEKKLTAFIEKAQRSKLCNFWKEESDLLTKVMIDLNKQMALRPGIGWIRANETIPTKAIEELTTLSVENRSLRAKVNELEARVSDSTPCIEVITNNNQPIRLTIPSSIPSPNARVPKRLNTEEIPEHLLPYIKDEEIRQYNNSIPTQDEVDNYNLSSRLFWLIKNHAFQLPLKIKNTGSKKANDIRILITIPAGILLLNEQDRDDLENPENPVPASPIEKAERIYQQNLRNPSYSTLLAIGEYALPGATLKTLNSRSLISMPHIRNPNHKLRTNKQEISIFINSLLHTIEHTPLEAVFIVPTTTGTFTADATIIYEESRDKISTSFKIEVVPEE